MRRLIGEYSNPAPATGSNSARGRRWTPPPCWWGVDQYRKTPDGKGYAHLYKANACFRDTLLELGMPPDSRSREGVCLLSHSQRVNMHDLNDSWRPGDIFFHHHYAASAERFAHLVSGEMGERKWRQARSEACRSGVY